jgi:hypothetical protein
MEDTGNKSANVIRLDIVRLSAKIIEAENKHNMPWNLPEDYNDIMFLIENKCQLCPGAKRHGKKIAKIYQIEVDAYKINLNKMIKSEYEKILLNLKTNNLLSLHSNSSVIHPVRYLYTCLSDLACGIDSESTEHLIALAILRNRSDLENILLSLKTDIIALENFVAQYPQSKITILGYTPIEIVHSVTLTKEYQACLELLQVLAADPVKDVLN